MEENVKEDLIKEICVKTVFNDEFLDMSQINKFLNQINDTDLLIEIREGIKYNNKNKEEK